MFLLFIFAFCCWVGYDLEIAEDGIEGEYEEGDGEAEYYGNNGEGEEEYYDEDYGYIYDESLETKPAVKSIRPHSLAGTSRPRESLPVPSNLFNNRFVLFLLLFFSSLFIFGLYILFEINVFVWFFTCTFARCEIQQRSGF